MEKSTIKSIEPLIFKGEHQSWEKDGITYYKFMITMDDGSNGTISSKKTESPWKVGDEITYTYNNGFISNIKRADSNWSENRKPSNYYDDPKVQANITKNQCLKISTGFLAKYNDQSNIKKGDVFQLAGKFYNWCYQDFKDNQQLLNKRAALERALECMEISSEGISSSATLINQAEDIIGWISQESASPF
jgi:hypothetical protein